MKKWLSLSLLVLLFAYVTWAKQRKPTLPIIAKMGAFVLEDQNSQPFTGVQLQNSVWIVNTFFTNCQGPCPLMTAKMAQLQTDLEKIPAVHFLSLSVDPENDTPAALKAYSEKFHAKEKTWFFVTGQKDQLYQVIKNVLNLPMEDDVNLHSIRFVLIDSEGNIRGYYDSLDEEKLKDIKADATQLANSASV